MLFKKLISLSVISTSVFIFSNAHAAKPLLIINNTDESSTSIINDGGCSSDLQFPGLNGITAPHSQNVIPSIAVGFACGIRHQSDCKADIYMTANCKKGGDAVATVTLDTNNGVKSIEMKPGAAARYTLSSGATKDGFSITMDVIPTMGSAQAAGGFTINNQSSQYASFAVNGDVCSSTIKNIPGFSGIFAPNHLSTISSSQLQAACHAKQSSCSIWFYPSSDCERSGQAVIATMTIDSKAGTFTSFSNVDAAFLVTQNGFGINIKRQ